VHPAHDFADLVLLAELVVGGARPDWTLLVISYLLSGIVVVAMRSALGMGE